MARWSLDYQITKKATGSDKFTSKCINTNGTLKLSLGGPIPDGPVEQLDEVMKMVEDAVKDVHGKDAKTPKAHADILRTIAAYCNDLADKLTK